MLDPLNSDSTVGVVHLVDHLAASCVILSSSLASQASQGA